MSKYTDSRYVKVKSSEFRENLSILDSDLQKALRTIDTLKLNISVFNLVGNHTPAIGAEYPDLTNASPNDGWVIYGLGSGISYTFTTGELTGKSVTDGDSIVYTGNPSPNTWGIVSGAINSSLYYKLDGSQPLTANFNAGTNKLINVVDGTEDTDAVTIGQALLKIGGTVTGEVILNASQGSKLIFSNNDSHNFSSDVYFDIDGTHRANIWMSHWSNGLAISVMDVNGDGVSSLRLRWDGEFYHRNAAGHEAVIWHEDNFNPNTKLNKTGGSITGYLEVDDYVHFYDNLDVDGDVIFDSGLRVSNDIESDGGIYSGGNEVWHAGNFNPSGKENALGNPTQNGYVLASSILGVRSWIPMTGGSGVSTFKGLTDTPNAFTGAEGMFLKVNQTANGIVFEAGSGVTASFSELTGNATDNSSLATELSTLQSGINNNATNIGNNATAISELQNLINEMFTLTRNGSQVLTEITANVYFSSDDEVEAFK